MNLAITTPQRPSPPRKDPAWYDTTRRNTPHPNRPLDRGKLNSGTTTTAAEPEPRNGRRHRRCDNGEQHRAPRTSAARTSLVSSGRFPRRRWAAGGLGRGTDLRRSPRDRRRRVRGTARRSRGRSIRGRDEEARSCAHWRVPCLIHGDDILIGDRRSLEARGEGPGRFHARRRCDPAVDREQHRWAARSPAEAGAERSDRLACRRRVRHDSQRRCCLRARGRCGERR